MSELRQDPTTGAFVIIAPERAKRPGVHASAGPDLSAVPPYDASCPFCPGSEDQLVAIVAETPAPAAPGWSVRAVSNKYAALAPIAEGSSVAGGLVVPGYGFHEVIIESPRHDADLTTLAPDEMRAVVASYQERFSELARQPAVEAVILFRNHGAKSGSSLVHPHAQVLGLPLIPPKQRAIANWGAKSQLETGTCPTCTALENELALGARTVEESRHFVALVPFAPEVICEQWIVPRRHHATFLETRRDELDDLAMMLAQALRRLKAALSDPPYNFAIESLAGSSPNDPAFHWRLRIAPEVINTGGFERGTGMAINAASPEADAELLRQSLNGQENSGRAST
jgi:UDPglucose--hexose-1-phosphate uridylyltransferase